MILGTPKIERLPAQTLVGMRKPMSMESLPIVQLWRAFMPRHREVQSRVGMELYAVRDFTDVDFRKFHPATQFDVWAAVKVSDVQSVPKDMEVLNIPAGEYLFFTYKGLPDGLDADLQNLRLEWLPALGCRMDSRPFVAAMGAEYRNGDPNSEEKIWMPVQLVGSEE
jgi:AraC family transcriptional regulator